MNFFTGFLRTIILLGAVQGFIISSLLFFSKKSTQSSRILSKLIFLLALASFKLYASIQGWFNYSDLMRILDAIIPMVIVMPFGPLIFFYVKSLLDPDFKLGKKDRIHFYPIIIDLVPQIMAIIYILALIFGLIKNNYKPFGVSLGTMIDNYNVYVDIPRWISVSTYLMLSARLLSHWKLKTHISIDGQKNNFKWLNQFIRLFLVFQIIWLIYLVPYVIPKYTDVMLDTFDWYPIYIPMAILIYWLGIKGYMGGSASLTTTSLTTASLTTTSPVDDSQTGKKLTAVYTALSDAAIEEFVVLLTNAMKADKLYLDPLLNLQIISKHTNIPQKTISAVLNQHLHKSFNEFVNEYRIEIFKEKLQDPALDHLTIAGIAFECGFNSQATFQRAFKQATGLSPSEFRNTSLEIQ